MIVVDPALCSGCRGCEVACSFYHSGMVGRNRARVKLVKIEGEGVDFPVVCRQCRERHCLKCPESALSIGDRGQIVASPTLCTACGTCEKLCPIGAIELFEQIPYVCDLCGGDPRCVKQCTLGAIRYEPGQGETVSLAPVPAECRRSRPDQRRFRHAREMTRQLREQWEARREAG